MDLKPLMSGDGLDLTQKENAVVISIEENLDPNQP